MHTAWLAQTFYLHWCYTGDHRYARDVAYPWCHDALIAIESLLIEGADGKMRLPLSTSPEIHDNSPKAWLTPNSNYDQALLMFLYEAVAELADASRYNYDLNKDGVDQKYPESSDAIRARAAKLGTFDVDPTSNALTFAKGEPYNQSHRHFSHAMAIHPLGILNIEGSDSDRAIISATLDELEKVGTKQWVGYSFSWYSAMCARAGRAEQALKYLELFTNHFTSRNGFHLNGDQSGKRYSDFSYRPFTLEGNFLAMHAVHEMLLQSWGSRLRIFPAVSAQWPDVSFTDLHAERGYRVSARRVGGETREVTITSTSKGTLRLRKPFATVGTWNMPFRVDGDDLLFDLLPGSELRGGE
jgi:alpha-L-fucosidase 2